MRTFLNLRQAIPIALISAGSLLQAFEIKVCNDVCIQTSDSQNQCDTSTYGEAIMMEKYTDENFTEGIKHASFVSTANKGDPHALKIQFVHNGKIDSGVSTDRGSIRIVDGGDDQLYLVLVKFSIKDSLQRDTYVYKSSYQSFDHKCYLFDKNDHFKDADILEVTAFKTS